MTYCIEHISSLLLLILCYTDAFAPVQNRFVNSIIPSRENSGTLFMSSRTQSTYNTGYSNTISEFKYDAPVDPSTQSKLVAYKNPDGVITGVGKSDENGLRNGSMVSYQNSSNSPSLNQSQNNYSMTNSNYGNQNVQNYDSNVPYYAQDYYYPYRGYGYGYGGYPYYGYGISPYYSPFWGHSPWFGYGPYAMMNYYNYWNHWGFWPYGRSYYHWM